MSKPSMIEHVNTCPPESVIGFDNQTGSRRDVSFRPKRGWRPPIRIENGVAIIPLTQGQVALVDEADLPKVQGRIWRAQRNEQHNTWYACTGQGKTFVMMHRIIAATPDGLETDHKNLNGLDNRRDNLRPATRFQNQANTLARNPKSGFKGVYPSRNGWQVRMRINGKYTHVAYHKDKEQAARLYDERAVKEFGEFARLNFPSESVA